MRLIKLIIVVTFLLAPIVFGAFLYIDRQVATTLQFRQSGEVPAVLSETLRITQKSGISARDLVGLLDQRRYTKSDGTPKAAGEYFTTADRIELISRSFVAADGRESPSKHLIFYPDRGTIENRTTPADPAIVLEPIVIAPLTGGSQRASQFVRLSEIPRSIKNAVIAIEDQRFYSHHGIDPIGIVRALGVNLVSGRVAQGGSTITQQLAKNLFLTPEKTITRKAKEVLASFSLERRLTKDQILELYLNEVYLGQEGNIAVHGVAEAAKTFFGKDVQDLSLPDSALLAGIIRAPSAYSPRRNPDQAVERRNVVLQAMYDQQMISRTELARALREEPKIIKTPLHQSTASFFIAGLRRTLDAQFDLDAATLNGVQVYTGLVPEFQECGEQALKNGIAKLLQQQPGLAKRDRNGELEAGLVSIEPFSGRIRAWVGGLDYSKNQYDHVDLAKRQVGSTIKPFLYLTTLDGSLNDYKVATPITILPDRPIQIDLITKQHWEPENYDKKFRGDVTLRYALENSLNIPAAYTAQRVGIKNLVKTVKAFHISPNPPAVPALALGALETTLLDLTSAYAALANGGVYVAPRLYLSALDHEDQIIARSELNEERVANEAPVYILTNILQGAVDRGTAKSIRSTGFTGTVAGKTGTSNDTRDAWFIGYSPALATGVWVGFDDNRKVGLTGGVASAPIWSEYMQCISRTGLYEDTAFIPPRGVVLVEIDAQSGELPSSECPEENVVSEYFVDGTQPKRLCRLHGGSSEEIDSGDSPGGSTSTGKDGRRKRGFWEQLFG